MPDATGLFDASVAPPSQKSEAVLAPGVQLAIVGWVIVASLGLVALLRLVAWDFVGPLVVLDALTWVIYLPAWLVAAAALIARRWRLAAAAVVVVAAQIAFVTPEFLAAAPVPSWAAHAHVIRVFDANLDHDYLFENGYLKAVEQDRPDLVAFEELTPSALQGMEASGMLASFPYRCVAPRLGAFGFLLASKWRMTGCKIVSLYWDGQQAPYMVKATLSAPAGPVAVRVVHTLAPLPWSWSEWADVLAAVNRSVRASGDQHMLMVGDFNATWGNAGFVDLLHAGLTDGAAARGHAFELSWPNGAIVPPFVRIDHVLTGSQLSVTTIDAGPGFGSDHRYLTAIVAVRG